MTYEEAVEVIHSEAARHGEPVTRDVAEHIAKKLFGVVDYSGLKPGQVAQNHRERYSWDADVADANLAAVVGSQPL